MSSGVCGGWSHDGVREVRRTTAQDLPLLAGCCAAGCGEVRLVTAWDLPLLAGCCAAGCGEVRLVTALDTALGWLVYRWFRWGSTCDGLGSTALGRMLCRWMR